MNLEEPSRENIEKILNGIKTKLTVVNQTVLNPDHFSLENYEELLDIYYMLEKKQQISISEMQAIVDELGRLRSR